MTIPKVFIASSSEALDVVNRVHELLQRELSGIADVCPWPGQFELTKTYIESLEQLLLASDFAVLVLTPDDCTISRDVQKSSPRDNVVFELGLFFGRLGRERCFLIQRHDLDLKLPSDLLGIEPARFSLSTPDDLKTTLDSACDRIAKAIREATVALPSRPRPDDAGRATQAAMRRFGDRIKGTWWERILLNGEESGLAFLSFELEDTYNSIRLNGEAYGPDGSHRANIRSTVARLESNKLVYVRECQRLDTKSTVWRPGLGEVDFKDSGDSIERGTGKFWESDESHPEDTLIKNVQLRRNHSDSDTFTMQHGSDAKIRTLVQKILKKWKGQKGTASV